MRLVHNDAVLYFASVPDSNSLTNAGVGSDIAIGTYITVSADESGTFNVGARADSCPVFNDHRTYQVGSIFDLSLSLGFYLLKDPAVGFK